MEMDDQNIKYTVVLPVEYVSDLKRLAADKVVPSVNAAIREAVETYIVNRKHEEYVKGMTAASKDPAFMESIRDIQKAFEYADNEVDWEW